MFRGQCHCGAVRVEFHANRAPDLLPVRICGCTFCIKHSPKYTTDPTGRLAINANGERSLIRYRFGLKLADFLMCSTCGVFVAAVQPGTPERAVLNLNVLEDSAEFTAQPTKFERYDSETETERLARRAANWTAVDVRLGNL